MREKRAFSQKRETMSSSKEENKIPYLKVIEALSRAKGSTYDMFLYRVRKGRKEMIQLLSRFLERFCLNTEWHIKLLDKACDLEHPQHRSQLHLGIFFDIASHGLTETEKKRNLTRNTLVVYNTNGRDSLIKALLIEIICEPNGENIASTLYTQEEMRHIQGEHTNTLLGTTSENKAI